MTVRTAFPQPIRTIEHTWITLADGCRLAARIWLPVDAEQRPVPAILEYLPYRKNDATAARDALRHPYFAGHGYAAVRVDARGSGDSDGLLRDEYLPQEQLDGLEVLAWLARQPWCTGAVGMIGNSWGGFNALQIAARRPPALRAIVTCCAADDRYGDDIHYMGGCLLAQEMNWNSSMFTYNARPPDPAVVGERWRAMWRERLEQNEPFIHAWLTHQRRDAYWRQGSVCEDYAAIACPVFAVGGWADGYTNAIPRLLAGLRCPRRGLIGPWGHGYPDQGAPGPAIGFLQECLRWWDRWLKGVENGVEREPMLRAWLQEMAEPLPCYAERPGRWVAEPAWPSPSIRPQLWHLTAAGLAPTPTLAPTAPAVESGTPPPSPLPAGLVGDAAQRPVEPGTPPAPAPPLLPFPVSGRCPQSGRWVPARRVAEGEVRTPTAPDTQAAEERVDIMSQQTAGQDGGVWCPYGRAADLPTDQRAEDGRALSFTSTPLAERIELLGFPEVELELAADQPLALVAVRLCGVAPTGASTLLSRGLLNLTHRESDAKPAPLEPGRRYRVRLRLNALGQAIPAGYRLRVAVAPTYWPLAWPSPAPVTLSLFPGAGCRIELPVRPPRAEDARLRPFEPPETAPPLPVDVLRPDGNARTIAYDVATGRLTVTTVFDGGTVRQRANGLTLEMRRSTACTIVEGDPLSAEVRCTGLARLERGDWRTRVETESLTIAAAAAFHTVNMLDAYEGDERVFSRTWRFSVPRDLV